VVGEEPVPPRQLNARVPIDLETTCLKCLHKEPARRYAHAADLAEDLRRFQAGEPITARPVGKAERLWRWCRRNPLFASGAATIALTLTTVVLLATLAARNAQAVAAAERENAHKDEQRLQQALFEQARAERLLGNRWRALELIAEASRNGSSEDLRQEAIQAVTASGAHFVREVAVDLNKLAKDGLSFKQLPEYDIRFPQLWTKLTRGADGGAELVFQEKKLTTLPPHLGLPKKCILSPDGRLLAFRDVTEPDLIRIWDCQRRLLHGRLPTCGDLAMIGNLVEFFSGNAFSPDGVLLASTHARGGGYMLQVNEIDSKRTLMTRDGLVVAGWSSNGNHLLTSSRVSLVGLASEGGFGWDIDPDPGVKVVAAFAQVWEVSCPVPTYQIREPVERLLFRTDGCQLAVNDTVWDVQPGNTRIALRETTTTLEGQDCLLGFRDTEVWGISLAEGRPARDKLAGDPAHSLRGQREFGSVLAAQIAVSVPGPGTLPSIGCLFADLERTRWQRPRVIRFLPPNLEITLAPPSAQRLDMTFQGPCITYYFPGRLAWSRDGAKVLATVMHGMSGLESSDTKHYGLASRWGSALCFVEAWDIPSGNRFPLTLPEREWKDIAWHPEGRRFATASPQGVQVWDLATATELMTLSKENFDHVVWSNEGKYLLAVKQDKKAAVYTPEGREACRWTVTKKDWSSFTLSGEGHCVVTSGEDGLVRVLDVETGKELACWKAHDAAVTALTFSPDGTLLVSGARDGTVRVWNLPWIHGELSKLGLDW
jgi:eukaryotic-like serine/threonine-protein kinase